MAGVNFANILSGNFDDRVDDATLEVMNRMDDDTLYSFCQTSTFYRQLCEKNIVRQRIRADPGLTLLLSYLSHYKDLVDFFFNIRNDTQYVLEVRESVITERRVLGPPFYVSNNIADVYNKLPKLIASDLASDYRGGRNLTTDQARLQYVSDDMYPDEYIIAIRFNNVVDHYTLDNYILYSTKASSPKYNNPDILLYPTLVPKTIYAFISQYIGTQLPSRQAKSAQAIIKYSFINFDVESLRNVHRLGKNGGLLFRSTPESPTTDKFTGLTWIYYGFDIQNNKGDLTSLMLIDADKLPELKLKGYYAMVPKFDITGLMYVPGERDLMFEPEYVAKEGDKVNLHNTIVPLLRQALKIGSVFPLSQLVELLLWITNAA